MTVIKIVAGEQSMGKDLDGTWEELEIWIKGTRCVQHSLERK